MELGLYLNVHTYDEQIVLRNNMMHPRYMEDIIDYTFIILYQYIRDITIGYRRRIDREAEQKLDGH
jgi:hypothetical protein